MIYAGNQRPTELLPALVLHSSMHSLQGQHDSEAYLVTDGFQFKKAGGPVAQSIDVSAIEGRALVPYLVVDDSCHANLLVVGIKKLTANDDIEAQAAEFVKDALDH